MAKQNRSFYVARLFSSLSFCSRDRCCHTPCVSTGATRTTTNRAAHFTQQFRSAASSSSRGAILTLRTAAQKSACCWAATSLVFVPGTTQVRALKEIPGLSRDHDSSTCPATPHRAIPTRTQHASVDHLVSVPSAFAAVIVTSRYG